MTDPLEPLIRELLLQIGENPDREGLIDTPARVARFWREFIGFDSGKTDTTFGNVSVGNLLVMSPLRVYSLCEHHLLPFWCDVSIGIIQNPNAVLGLSKYVRVCQKLSHALQLQEQLTAQIHAELCNITQTPDVIVHTRGVHLCMAMRGVHTASPTVALASSGQFSDSPTLRHDFYALLKVSG